MAERSPPPRPNPPPEPDDPGSGAPMRAALWSVAAAGVALAFGALATFGAHAAAGVAIGAVIATANLAVFARLGDALVGGAKSAAPWGAIALLKLVFLFGGVWMLLKADLVPPLALAFGYSALPLGITLSALFGGGRR